MLLNSGRPSGESGESGQAILLFIMVMTVMFVIGALVVDVGLFLTEHRAAQKDADVTALAGAWELIDPGATSDTAQSAASQTLDGNNQELNASFRSDPVVDLANRCVTTDVGHTSGVGFLDIFGAAVPDIGATAKACAGAAEAPSNLVPFEITVDSPCFDTNGAPIFTQMCWVAGGAHHPNDRGILDLQAGGGSPPYCSQGQGSGDIENLIANGAPGTCLINSGNTCNPDNNNGPWYDCVAPQSGNPNNSKIQSGTNERVSRDGLCDANAPNSNHNGIDDLYETVVVAFDTGDPTTSIYTPRDCDPSTPGLQASPRLVTIIVLQTNPGSHGGTPIYAFAGMYIAGCGNADLPIVTQADLDPYCGNQLTQQLAPRGSAGEYVSAALPGPVAAPLLSKTLVVKKLVVGGTAQPSDFTITVKLQDGTVVSTFPGSASGTNVVLPNGAKYNVTETGPSGYAASYSANCSGSIGNGATCTITNTFLTPTPTPSPTPTPTPTPVPTATPTSSPSPTSSPTPTPNPNPGCSNNGNCGVFGQLINIIYTSGGIGPITGQTTVFGIALVQ